MCAALTAMACLLPIRAYAQGSGSATRPDDLSELALEDLLNVEVYAASKFMQDVTHAPASVSVVGADEIRRHGYRTIADILRSVRGIYITYDRDYRYVGIRGFARPGDFNSRVLLLVNGHRLNDIIFEQALIGTESPIDVSVIERVEVVRGPGSSLYGTSAFLAVVNVITRRGADIRGTEIEGAYGSQQLRTGRLTLGTQHASGLDTVLAVSGFETLGASRLYFPGYDSPATANGIASNVDGDRGASAFGSLEKGGFRLQGGLSRRTKTVPTAAYETLFNDPRTNTRDRRAFLDAEYTRHLSPRTTLQTRVAFDDYRYDGHYAYAEGMFVDDARGNWLTAESSLTTHSDRHGLTLGGEFRDNLRQDQSAVDHTGVLLDDRRNTETAALFIEDEFRLNPHVLLNAGARWDHYFDTFGGTINPRLGLILLPRTGTALKALYGRAFRAPNPFELYYDQNALSAALQPERISTYELVFEQRVARSLQLTASAFSYRARDLIAQRKGSDTVDGLYYQNADTMHAQGVEVELQVELPHRLRARASQVLQRTADALTDAPTSNSPSHMSNAVIDVPLGRSGLVVGLNAVMIGRRHTIGGAEIDRRFVTDVTISRPAPAHGVGLSIVVSNLFNAAYADPGSVEHLEQSIPQDGRTALARATWRF